MKRMTLIVAAGLIAVSSGCDCGGGTGGTGGGTGSGVAGSTCKSGADCKSGVCTASVCAAGPDGGPTGAGGGNGTGGGTGTGGSGGGVFMGTLPDGGACENLQCQVKPCPAGTSTTITGKVYDPGSGLGGARGDVPLYNVTVFVPNRPLKALPIGPSCDGCGAQISGNPVAIALTGSDGAFTLNNVPSGTNIPLVMQMGKWRRQVTLPTVTACQANVLTDPNVTRLPRSRAEGDLPQFAIATGSADAFQCLLKKIGIADSEVTLPSEGGKVHFYRENGWSLAGGTAPNGAALWTDGGTLMNYDVVLLPCEGGRNNKAPAVVQNMVNYANKGGRIFATHYSYVWTFAGWPQAADWRPDLMPDLYASVFNVAINQSFPKGQAFAQWLQAVGASPVLGTLGVTESRHDVVATNVGSTMWLNGQIPAGVPPESVQHLTFNTPFSDGGTVFEGGGTLQCGRVVFSDFHVTAGATNGGTVFPTSCQPNQALSAQEKALEFMLFDLSACVQNDNTAPTVCSTASQSCKVNGDCCAGLACTNASMQPCAGATGCTCKPTIT